MKNAILCFLFLSLPMFGNSQVSDMSVTASHVFGSTLGSITISISTAYSQPFSVLVTGPGGYTLTTTITSNNYNISNLQHGEYCITVSNSSSCSASLCIEIKKCSYAVWNGVTYITCIERPIPGDPSITYARGVSQGNSTSYNYDLTSFTTLTTPTLNQIYGTISLTTDSINTFGHSFYDIDSQNEIDANGYDFVFKFVNANIAWVYHPNVLDRNFSGSLPKDKMYVSVIPNPASERISVIFPSDSFLGSRLFIFDASGSLVISDLVAYATEFPIDISRLTAGMYFIKSYSSNGVFTSKFSVFK